MSLGVFDIGLGLTEIILILFIFVFTFGIPIALVVFLVRYLNKKERSNAGLKKCAFCASQIPAEASVCRFCTRELTAAVIERPL